MSTKREPIETAAIQKKIDKLKEKYSARDFIDKNYHRCKKIIFYVPETNRFYGFDNIPYEYSSFINNGGTNLLNIDNAQEFNMFKLNRWFWSNILFDENDLNEFKKNNPWSGIESFSFTDRYRPNYINNISSQFMYAVCYTENPQIEKMIKTNLRPLVEKWIVEPTVLYKRSFKNGNNINEITNLPKFAWQMMSNEALLTNDINAWNEVRIWVQKDNLTKEQLRIILNLNLYDTKTIKDLRGILSAEYNGNRIFNIETLLNYLQRVDMYQAISPRDAIPILNDYIRMCKALNVLPLTDSNSLKREHDVTVRQFNEQKYFAQDKEYSDKFEKRYEELSKYEFSDGKLMVVIPKTPEDIRKEGRENRNCVGSYTSDYANGKSNVMFIRRCAAPENSYITIELTDDCSSTRQAFYSSNRRITNEHDLKFIDTWLENNKQVNFRLEEPNLEKDKIIEPVKETLSDKINRSKSIKDEINKNQSILQGEQTSMYSVYIEQRS